VKPLTRNEDEEFLRDINLAGALLNGQWIEKGGLPYLELLSADTKPTEREARLALYRVLRRMSEDYPRSNDGADPRYYVLRSLAAVFAPFVTPDSGRPKAILKRQNQGHSNAPRDSVIAYEVSKLRSEGLSYDKATAAAADKFGKSQDQVKRVYGREKRRLAELQRALARRGLWPLARRVASDS
jgi:hypothetical protein